MAEVIGFAGLGVLIIIQDRVFSYHYGRLNQKVDANSSRLKRIEQTLNGEPKSPAS